MSDSSHEQDFYKLRSDMELCSSSLSKDIQHLKSLADTPEWIKTTAIALVFTVFTQTIAAVWWASSITQTQSALMEAVSSNTSHRIKWKDVHSQTLQSLQRLEITQQMLREDLLLALEKQRTHFQDINNIYNDD